MGFSYQTGADLADRIRPWNISNLSYQTAFIPGREAAAVVAIAVAADAPTADTHTPMQRATPLDALLRRVADVPIFSVEKAAVPLFNASALCDGIVAALAAEDSPFAHSSSSSSFRARAFAIEVVAASEHPGGGAHRATARQWNEFMHLLFSWFAEAALLQGHASPEGLTKHLFGSHSVGGLSLPFLDNNGAAIHGAVWTAIRHAAMRDGPSFSLPHL